MALPRGALGLSAVCDCGISLSYSLTIFEKVQRTAEILSYDFTYFVCVCANFTITII